MKTSLYKTQIKTAVLLCLLLLPCFSFSATYYSRVTGNWNVAATWSTVGCGGAAAATPPGATDDVVICNTYAVTVTADPTINHLTIDAGGVLNDGGFRPTINGNLTVNGTVNGIAGSSRWTFNGAGTTIDGSGTCNIGDRWENSGNKTIQASASLTFVGIAGVVRRLNINSGTVTNNGSIILSNCDLLSGGTWTNAANSSLTVPSLNTVATFNASASGNTVNYNGSGAQTVRVPSDGAYHHLTVSNAGTKTYGGALVINGNLTISGAAQLDVSIVNYATTVGGNWMNSSSNADAFVQQSGTVTLNGSSGTAQTVSVSSATETFYNLTVNNTSGDVTLASGTNTNITNILTLTSGAVTTSSATDYFIHSNTTAANLVFTGGFVNGNLRRNIVSNTSTYDFPVSNGTASTDKHKVSFVNNSLTGVSYLNVKVEDFTQSAPNDDANLNTAQGVNIISTSGEAAGQTIIWTITPDAAPTGGSYGVQLYVENTNLSGADDNTFCPLKRNATSSYADWDTYSATTTIPADGAAGRIYNAGAGYAERTGYTSFSQFSIGKGSGPLPIELVSFTCSSVENGIKLEWVTASETNNDYFEIERNNARLNDQVGQGTMEGWNVVGKIQGAGNSSSTLHYEFIDHAAEQITNLFYYRLKQTDRDGKSETFPAITSCEFTNNTQQMKVYPNPSTSASPIYIDVPQDMAGEEILVVAMDVMGKEAYSKIIVVNSTGKGITAIDPSGQLPSGVYLITASSANNLYKQKLVIK